MHRSTTEERIVIGISSCLLGEPVRYNGGHKRDRYITETLDKYFDFQPFCPEVAIGLGVPRPTIRLEQTGTLPVAVVTETGRDVTAQLDNYGREIGTRINHISGYILKSRSPSCGMERVKVFDKNGVPSANGSGIYARALMECQPLLPVEEEGRLNDPELRDNFLMRVFIYHRWQSLNRKAFSIGDLVQFHTEYKYLIMAHDQNVMRELGRLVANAKDNMETTADSYIVKLMQALGKPAKRSNHVNVLQHIAGFFKDVLDDDDREELNRSIEAYRQEEIPIIVPMTLIRHHLRKNPNSFLQEQHYLS